MSICKHIAKFWNIVCMYYVVFLVCVSRECVHVCIISISVSATDGPNTQFCSSLVSRPCLIARQEQQQEAVCVLLYFHVSARVCISICVCSHRPSFISQAVGRTPCSLGHLPSFDDISCLKWLWVCLCFRMCVDWHRCVFMWMSQSIVVHMWQLIPPVYICLYNSGGIHILIV